MPTQSDTPTAPEQLVTVQEWAELEGPPHYDLVDGRLVERPDVALWHGILAMRLVGFLLPYIQACHLGELVAGPAKLKISDDGGREPDLFFIPVQQFDRAGKNMFKGVPPLVIEILSPSNAREDRGPKRRDYAGLGIGQYWIIDFAHRRLEVHELRDAPDGARAYELTATIAGDDTFRPALFPGLEIPLGAVWPVEFEHRTDD